MTTKNFECWSCQYFKPDDAISLISGRCHRFAPHSLDYYGFAGVEIELPLTDKGDLLTHDGIDEVRLPVGVDGQVLKANSTKPNGIDWEDEAGSPLTTKGDVMTHDGLVDVRLPVGPDGQVLTSNSAASNGIDWQLPAGGTSPLTSKGDIYTRNLSADERLAIGTDGQQLIADSSEATGQKWMDRSIILSYQCGKIGTFQGMELDLTRGADGGGPPPFVVASQFNDYNNGGEFPFAVPPNAEIVAVQMNLAKGAVGTATVGADPHLRVFFYDIDGSNDTFRGVVSIPIPQAKVGVNSNTGLPNYHQEFLKLSTPISPFTNGGFMGLRVDLTDNTDNEVIYAVRQLSLTVYMRTPLSDVLSVPLIVAAVTPPEDPPEVTPSFISPSEIPTSQGKYSIIFDGQEMWCGEYKRSAGTIPPIPIP